jgi:hypothetical protein
MLNAAGGGTGRLADFGFGQPAASLAFRKQKVPKSESQAQDGARICEKDTSNDADHNASTEAWSVASRQPCLIFMS